MTSKSITLIVFALLFCGYLVSKNLAVREKPVATQVDASSSLGAPRDQNLIEPQKAEPDVADFKQLSPNHADPIVDKSVRPARLEPADEVLGAPANPGQPGDFAAQPSSVIRVSYVQEAQITEAMVLEREYQLRDLSCEEFERRLLDVWGNRLQVSAEDGGRMVHVALPTREANAGSMTIDRIKCTLVFDGPDSMLSKWRRAMLALDSKSNDDASPNQIMDIQKAEPATIQKAVAIMETVQIAGQEKQGEVRRAIPLTRTNRPTVVAAPNQQPAQANPNGQQGQQGQQGLSGTVRVEVIPELNLLILYGKPEDVAYVQKVLSNLIKSADAAQPDVQVYPLKNVSGQAIAAQVQTLYDNNFATQQGPVSVTGLDQPNGLLLIGRKENIDSAIKLIENLDVAPTEQPEQFKSIRLKYMSAIDARERLNTYFAQQTPTGATGTTQPNPPLTFVADFRSNTLIVKGGAANIALVEKLIAELDVVDSPSKNEVRVFPIRNALASELAAVLQDAINGQLQNAGQGYAPQTQGAGLGAGGAQNRVEAQAPGDPTSESRLRSAVLELMTVDKNGKVVDGGILFDVRVSADANSNSLVVTGPSRSMDLIAALVERLDVVPDVDIKIKVFRLVHGDAPTLLTTLQQLFGSQTQAGNTGGAFLGQTNNLQSQLPLQSSSAGAGASIAGLRFGIDTRTNTLIVSGPEGDLQVIEDLIVRLDEVDIDTRSVRVYRLSNAPAEDVAQALNSYIDGRRDIITNDPAAVSAFEQVRRELIVIPEIVSNSLIISATPEYFAELESVIQALDRRPAMVKVKVLLAQVTLNAVDEFGVEVGVQDSLLFDRGLSNIRYPFNQTAIGNDNSALSLAGREKLAGQGLSNLSIGRSNSELGYGGLVLSAGNESINVLLRALQDRNAVRVLAKPHITTVDNLLARVQVGQRVPTITQVNQTAAGGFSNSIEYTDVGIILEITPRVSPDGTIVMAVNATNSSLSDAPGIPLFTTAAGADPITSPIINETTAETTIMAHSGQTVVLSGLLQDSKADIRRGIPILSDIPVLGPLFRFDSEQASRSELLIVLTPYLVTGDEDIEIQNQVEYDRMHWCLGDVNEVFGELGYDGGNVAIQQVDQPAIYYPDQDPLGQQPSQGPQPAAPQSPPAKMDGAYAPGGSPSAGFQPPANASYPQVYYPDGEQKLPAQTEDVQQPDYLDPAQRVPLSKSVVPKQASNTQRRDVAQVPNGNSGYGISLTSGANTTNNASKIDTGALLR